MSADLTIRFAADMPPASVEVISPDYQTVGRVMLQAGGEATVHVPSEDSFLRVHLGSGRVATLTKERGQLERTISRATMAEVLLLPSVVPPQAEAGVQISRDSLEHFSTPDDWSNFLGGDLRTHLSLYSEWVGRVERPVVRSPQSRLPLSDDLSASVVKSDGSLRPGILNRSGDEATWNMDADSTHTAPERLEITHPGGIFCATIPGNTHSIRVRDDKVGKVDALLIAVRFASRQPVADTILSYLKGGDLNSAETMVPWVADAQDLLAGKIDDPYAAAVGAYLLLKIRRFDLLHAWVKNLADWFSFLPDGCVLWAWQQIHQNPSNAAEIRQYLLEAASRGLPVYSQGLRLLFDGLSMLPDDPEANAAAAILRNTAGTVLWNSPVTAVSRLKPNAVLSTYPVVCDVNFASEV